MRLVRAAGSVTSRGGGVATQVSQSCGTRGSRRRGEAAGTGAVGEWVLLTSTMIT
jgi:hypothetical protein